MLGKIEQRKFYCIHICDAKKKKNADMFIIYLFEREVVVHLFPWVQGGGS